MKALTKLTKFQKTIAAVFLLVEAALYCAYMALDIAHAADTTWIKFAAVALCFVVSFAYLREGVSFPNLLINTALLLTLAADVFLLVLNREHQTGILLFIAVQALYFGYLLHISKPCGKRRLTALLLARLPVLAGASALLFWTADAVIITAAVYILMSVCNIINCFVKPKAYLLGAGLILLLLCDLSVGIYNMRNFVSFPVPEPLCAFSEIGMWLFYLPSQVCVALNNLKLKKSV